MTTRTRECGVSDSGGIRPTERLRPALVVALIAGAVIGGWAGAYMRGSGMFYSDLFVGAILVLIVAIAGVAAAAAARTHRDETARALAAFAAMTVVAAGVLFAISSPYRGVSPGVVHFGRATMRADELPPFEWRMGSSCLIRDGEASVFSAEMNLRAASELNVSATFQTIPTGSWPRPGISIALVAPATSPVFYAADFGNGAEMAMDSADGLRGHLRFSAERVPDQLRSPGPEPARLTGSIEWDCTVPPSP
jgi:hypothetical protein